MPHEPDPAAGGRTIPDPGFAGDDGSAPADLAAALVTYAADPGRTLEVFVALQRSRLLVPVVAVLGEAEVDEAGLAHDKTSDMATALLTGRDGRQALLAFTGLDTLARVAARRASGAGRSPARCQVRPAGGCGGAGGRRGRPHDVRRGGPAPRGARAWVDARPGPSRPGLGRGIAT